VTQVIEKQGVGKEGTCWGISSETKGQAFKS
jgi:hypothetical protein